MKVAVNSIQQQTFQGLEVWIIDGNSSDGTQAYLQSLSAPFQYISEPDMGIYDAMNKGVQLSQGSWVYFLGSDDQLSSPSILSYVFQTPYASSISMLSGKVTYTQPGIPFIYSKHKKIKSPSWNTSMWIRNGLHHQATFYKKQLFKERLYQLKYQVLADYDFNLHAYKSKKQCLLLDHIIALCSAEGISKSGSKKMYREEFQLKVAQSSWIFGGFFWILTTLKYLLRKRMNASASKKEA